MDCGLAEFCSCTGTCGEWRRKLPTVTVKVGKGQERGQVDTASGCSLASKNVVKPHWILPGEWLRLECTHGGRERYPMAKIPLEDWGKFRWKRVGVVG